MNKPKIKLSTDNLIEYIKLNSSYKKTLFLDLEIKTVRIECYAKDFIPHIEKQIPYILRQNADKYDETIVIWQERDIDLFTKQKGLFKAETNDNKLELSDYTIYDSSIKTYSEKNKTYFYGVKDLEPEEFIKEGHIFVQTLYKILKTDNSNLIHGACIGLNNKGILLCARGQRGKSTLAVLSMLEGFDYVSDDYLTLIKEDNKLYASPIYSIITLSHEMYNRLYKKLDGTRFISNNAKKDKYVINISNFHDKFRKKYPITLCMFPEFTGDINPSIVECSESEKGRAIVQLAHSTTLQMLDMFDAQTIKKIINMVNEYKFFKINLCKDIYKNVQILKEFMKEYKND